MSNLTSTQRAAVMLVLSGVCYSFHGLWVKVSIWEPALLVIGRNTAAIGITLALLRLTGQPIAFRPRTKWDALIGLAYASTAVGFLYCSAWSTAATGAVMIFSGPLYTALFTLVVLREAIPRPQVLALSVASVGLGINFYASGGGEWQALLFGVLCGASWGAVPILVRLNKGPSTTGMIFGFLVCIALMPLAIRHPVTTAVLLHRGSLFGAIAGGFTSSAGAWLLMRAQIVGNFTPTFSLLANSWQVIANPAIVWLYNGEFPAGLNLVGDAVILSAVILLLGSSYLGSRRRRF